MTETHQKLWIEMLNSQLSGDYYAEKASKLAQWDQYSKVFLAIMSSGTVGGWALWNDSEKYPWLSAIWKGLSGIAALTSIALPLFNLSKRVEWATTLKNGFAASSDAFELIWLRRHDLNDPQILSRMADVKRKEDTLKATESHFPVRDTALLRKCQKAIIHRRGLLPEQAPTI